MAVRLKRAYDPADKADGTRILVDRLWPRGVSRQAARIDAWLRDLAPSDTLRRWFHERPARWPGFRRRYLGELSSPTATRSLEELHRLWEKRPRLTLVFSSRDREHNNAAVLRELLEGMRKPPTGTGPATVSARGSSARVARR